MIDPVKYPPLNLPIFEAKVRSEGNQVQIFDAIRKKYLVLTPEEWVRQHVIHYLIHEKDVPPSLIKLEYQINYARVKKRPDIAVVHPDGYMWLIVECKAPSIPMTKSVFDQALIYFSVEKPKFIALSNGIDHVYCTLKLNAENFVFIRDLPKFELS
ncbi:MAG: type I restriction enzyme HsdR N-terminal domain-containing protein [Salibacteraceae bacterium]|jgi:hypothetical protein|nr:type I restriction enzyme HsdR N-terminal domain-containing protein [Salibacteraceae bacterium]MDP4964546.1 type I restriction enzyme HsdR N-terminal domain-containing protein [Salibacteraceae bacterium]